MIHKIQFQADHALEETYVCSEPAPVRKYYEAEYQLRSCGMFPKTKLVGSVKWLRSSLGVGGCADVMSLSTDP